METTKSAAEQTMCSHSRRRLDWENEMHQFYIERRHLEDHLEDVQRYLDEFRSRKAKKIEEGKHLQRKLDFVELKLSTWSRAVQRIDCEALEDGCSCVHD